MRLIENLTLAVAAVCVYLYLTVCEALDAVYDFFYPKIMAIRERRG